MLDNYLAQWLSALLVSLRIAPVFVFAPPFTLLRVPPSVRLLLSLSLALWLVLANPDQTIALSFAEADLLTATTSELFIGVAITVALQWAYAAILTAGRAVDIQAGYGLALLADPALQGQMPLIGTVFAYGFAMVFFAIGGPNELLLIWSTSVQSIPIGTLIISPDIGVLLGFISSVFLIAVGLAGIVLLTLFLIDLTVAFLSRTLPQMNVLLIGFQVKTLAVLLTLPIALSYSASLFLRMIRMALQTSQGLY